MSMLQVFNLEQPWGKFATCETTHSVPLQRGSKMKLIKLCSKPVFLKVGLEQIPNIMDRSFPVILNTSYHVN
ncbi:hypothetical protein EFB08_02965 [Rufibacter latericius]|uniref:Uncharacterized protein n=1 Tax=Rufibacter latericius TaxID=2487040 RepID=A0A3M9N1A0_9BACT|nr:hypothetical protein EFB08_02965 [Rufibacter latericius]